MDSGKLNTRVVVKRQTQTADGYGGLTSTISDYATVWANLKEKKGDIKSTDRFRGRFLEVALIMRSKTVESKIANDDYLQIQGISGDYRITSIYESQQKYFTTIEAIKID